MILKVEPVSVGDVASILLNAAGLVLSYMIAKGYIKPARKRKSPPAVKSITGADGSELIGAGAYAPDHPYYITDL